MEWKRKVNEALGAFTGLRLVRTDIPQTAAPRRKRPEPEVRPPAHPEADRLLRTPIFVMSPVRSGSTLLRAVLNAHSRLHAPHELHVRRLTVDYGTKLAERAMKALGHNQADLEHLLWDRVLHRELVLSGKQYIVDKTPANAFAWQRIAACWPDARYLFLLRHPMSIAQSWHEASPERRDFQAAAEDALRYMKAVERARNGLDGLTVRYEDLVADPVACTRRICTHLGIPWEEQMLQYGEQKVLEKGLGDWSDKIRSGAVQAGRELPDPASISEVLRPMCKTWGYPV
ncbi:sulfotransferase [Streptosporangiaceae bacterium NEAU-GS5]|nr:sulfotransferase [Streptosporangiaceae bacterium NEAU-GS5]